MYQNMLSNLMADPSSVTKLPGYQFQFDQGMQALERSQAASGKLGGGTATTEAIQFGQGLASTSFNNWENILAQLAGGNIGNPGQAGQLMSQGISNAYGAIGQGLGSIGGALGKIGVSDTNRGYTANPTPPGGYDPYGNTSWGSGPPVAWNGQ
jgi:hypothetical protein